MSNLWHGQDFISIDSLEGMALAELFERSDQMKRLVEGKGGDNRLAGRVMASLFYEPSSRTFGSFAAAIQRLGGGLLALNMSNSSMAKGESLEDTAQTFSSYADIIVARNPVVGSVAVLAQHASVPVISAGDGIGEHPTQALLDAYTIQAELGNINQIHIVFVGELAHYRPVNSLSKLLALFPGVRISYVSAPECALQPGVREYLRSKNITFTEHENLDDVVAEADVLYVTRPKKEFIPEALYEQIRGKYILRAGTVKQMKHRSVVMHALPRIDEIAPEVDQDHRAIYLKKQMRNGMYVRMALLDLILRK